MMRWVPQLGQRLAPLTSGRAHVGQAKMVWSISPIASVSSAGFRLRVRRGAISTAIRPFRAATSDGRTKRTFTPLSLANRSRGTHRSKVLPLWYVQRRSGIAQSVIDVRFELPERRHSLAGTGSSR